MKNKRRKDHIGKDGKLKFRDCKVLFISSPQAAWGMFIDVCFSSSLSPSTFSILEGFLEDVRLFNSSENQPLL
jgi:hypothetical protein